MSFWRPGDKAPPSSLDRDAEREGGNVPLYNPRANQSLSRQRRLLPIAQRRREVLFALEKWRCVVIVGETGCGKSTQLPQYLDEAKWTAGGRQVVCTQPRRVAAMSVAARVADEMGVRLGDDVGYCVRFDDCCSPQTRLRFVTDGMLVRETLLDPLLSRYSVVMLDEAHERSLQTDVLLGLLKKVMRRRPDLRLIVSSATLDAQKFKEFFETNTGDDAKEDTATIFRLTGRQFPVEMLFREEPVADFVRATAETALAIHTSEPSGDILAFLPGQEEISRACELLQSMLPSDARPLAIMPLYADLPFRDQLDALRPARPTRAGQLVRKCVIATNIAETSVTIEGVVYVIDAGFVKLPFYDPLSGLETLVTREISKASANQRAGRAGRVRAGKCLRLYTEDSYLKFAQQTPPEMVRANLALPVLQLKALGVYDVAHFDFMDAPPAEAMIRALELLYSLGALDDSGALAVPRGLMMAEFPAEPRVSAMLLASLEMGCAEEALTIAAMTSVQNVFTGGATGKTAAIALRHFAVLEGDHLTLLNLYNGFLDAERSRSWCGEMGVKHRVLMRACEVRRQLRRYLQRVIEVQRERRAAGGAGGGIDSSGAGGPGVVALEWGTGHLEISSCGDDNEVVRRCVVAGFFANAARLDHEGRYRTVRDGRCVQLHPTSVLARFGQAPEWIVFNDVVLTSTEYIRECSVIDPRWLLQLAPHFYESRDNATHEAPRAASKRKAATSAAVPGPSNDLLAALFAGETVDRRGADGEKPRKVRHLF